MRFITLLPLVALAAALPAHSPQKVPDTKIGVPVNSDIHNRAHSPQKVPDTKIGVPVHSDGNEKRAHSPQKVPTKIGVPVNSGNEKRAHSPQDAGAPEVEAREAEPEPVVLSHIAPGDCSIEGVSCKHSTTNHVYAEIAN